MSVMLLKDKVVVVFGVGFGFGCVIVEQVVKVGADFVFVLCIELWLCEVVKEVEELGCCALVVFIDINDDVLVVVFVDVMFIEYGCIDVLINNVFAILLLGDFQIVDFDQVCVGFEINVFVVLCLIWLFVFV